MAYSFPPRGFCLGKDDNNSATENCNSQVNFRQEEAQYLDYNVDINEAKNGEYQFGYRTRTDMMGPPRPPYHGGHHHGFPGNNDVNWMGIRPRGRGPRPMYPGTPFPVQYCNPRHRFNNNWPRPTPLRQNYRLQHPFYEDSQNQESKRPKNGQLSQSEKKKNKKSRKEREELTNKQDYDFYCDMCDRGFNNNETFRAHLNSHVKCEYPGCKFEGAFKIVRQHKGMQHAPNSKPIGPLETSEEIERWREERRKKYPTASNVENKKSEIKERIKRGNVLKTKEFGKMRHKGEVLKDIDRQPNPKEDKKSSGNTSLGSLGSLMSAYGSDSEKSSQEEGEIIEDEIPTPVEQKYNSKFKKSNWQENRKRKKETKFKKNKKKIYSPNRKNLLEMLLANDIRHERNILLQCVRYIVSRGFFDTLATNRNDKTSDSCANEISNEVTDSNVEVLNDIPTDSMGGSSDDDDIVVAVIEKDANDGDAVRSSVA